MVDVQHPSYVVAGCRNWNREAFDETISKLPGRWHFIDQPQELNHAFLQEFDPSFIFFLHWSTRVESKITEKFPCVAFHMTDLPYGRGGSPLQHLILAGHKTTKLTAFRMTDDFDSGPVYLKRDLSLEGRAQDIYVRSSDLAAEMIGYIISEQPEPQPVTGEEVVFVRRRPEQSEIPQEDSLERLHDFIRMLDAEGYPGAYLHYGNYRLELTGSSFCGTHLTAEVKITVEPGS